MRNKLYYITYGIEGTNEIIYGELYALDTGYGIVELGQIERDKIYDDDTFYPNKTIEQFLKNVTGDIIESVEV